MCEGAALTKIKLCEYVLYQPYAVILKCGLRTPLHWYYIMKFVTYV